MVAAVAASPPAAQSPGPACRSQPAASDEVEPADWQPVADHFRALIADWLLLKPAGFVIASTLLFFCVACGFGSRRYCGTPSSARWSPSRLCRLPRRAPSQPAGISRRGLAMSTLQNLMDGFATALTPINLGWAFVGVTLGTLIGILPGIGPALTIALLLPVTATLDPAGAFIMFAGLYYGAMYGSSTTSILLNTPGESGSIVTAVEGNLMARQGRGAAALATAAIGSFVAGTIGTLLAHLPRAAHRQARHPVRAGRIFRADDAGLHHRLGPARRVHGPGPGQPVPRPRHRPGRHRHAYRPAALHASAFPICCAASTWWSWRSACSRWARRSIWHRGRICATAKIMPIKGSLFMTREEWSRSWKPWLRGTADRLSVRRAAGRRHRDSDLPLLFHSRRSWPSIRRNSARAPSRAWPDRKPPTMRRSRACWCRC